VADDDLGVETETSRGRYALSERLRTDRVTVHLDDVHITYRVYHDRRPSLADVFRGKRERRFREIKAVQGIDLTAHAGEAIGLIGRNGSGKSTLLKAMAGLLPVNGGEVWATSQPSLLGVGAALQPNLSGRRNIQLGGLALGLSSREIEGKIDEVVTFAGLQEFADLPLKAYSSGMRARLHFSIATAVQPEILLVDEALAVGDGAFKRKSEQRITELLDGAGTVFLVTHSLGAITDICTRVVWIDHGKVLADGDPHEVVEEYERFLEANDR
jgi:teichoic acid transport system ATP-binding protein